MMAGLLAALIVVAAAQEPPARPAEHQHQHQHAAPEQPGEQAHPRPEAPPHVPPITDEDRAAAFPDVHGHTVHDSAIHSFVLVDQLEWQGGDGFGWDSQGWIGRDVNRFWFRTEGEAEDGGVGGAEAHALYGRAIARWWDLVAGVRQDFEPGPARTWAAVGIQGLAPYWFEIEATAYLGESGRTHLRFESEYELLLTNRLILQPLVELDVFGKSDPERGIGAGLSSTEAGLRMRYEFRRELAPYVGVIWERKFFGTRERARAAGEAASQTRLVAGLRLWF